MITTASSTRFGSGQSVKRVEDAALLTGRGQFADDFNLPGQAVLFVLRSPHAHARIRSIDARAAKSMPGVIGIVTGEDLVRDNVKPMVQSADFKRADGSPTAAPPQRALAVEVTRYVGEAVVAIVAETKDQARDAAEAVVVDYEPLPGVSDVDEALKPEAPLVWPQAAGNIACEARHGKRDLVEAAFARAAHVVTLDLVNQRVVAAPIEPRATLASFDATSARTTMRVSCQTPTGLRDELTQEVLGVPPDSVRVLVGDVGGGFGMKTTLYGEDVLAAYCSRRLERPIKWTAERIDEFVAASTGRDVNSKAELALDASGKILALRVFSRANLGAYATPAGVVIQLLIGPWVSTSVYAIDAIDIHIQGVLTHTTPTGPYRGAGRPEAIYIIERLMDEAARITGIDRTELRRRNFLSPAQMPYTNAMSKKYDSGQFEKVMDLGLARADWRGFERRAAESKAKGKLRGQGIATFLEWTGADVFTERVTVTVSGDGFIEMFSATQGMGQGLLTTYAQLAVDVFGVPMERIRIVQGDTDRGTGFGSAGSRSLFVGGSAIFVAANETIDKAKSLAADELEAAASDIEYASGEFHIGGTDRRVGLFELAKKQEGGRIVLDSSSSVDDCTWPNGCHVCEVEIDPDTGEVTIEGYWSVNDVGRVVNPMIVKGQLEGGALQGIGQALCEHLVYDRESAQPLSGTLMDYALPRASLIKHFDMTMDESTPCRNNLLGVKGVGELGTIGATPTVMNAIVDALARAGVANAHAIAMPATAERVWRALHE
ncbi:MAG TPA: xanthine dehydrogenase family protein molybdopterin-binding subunit [Casimicrobiaceae bacterium]|nr:xanthine dehydrogenase family protein molybdopterin-binding subunit [Casimicrobiaceae bacterium]